MIEFKKLPSGYVEMYEDEKFLGVFPTEKRGRLFASGERDIEGNKIEKKEEIETVSMASSATASTNSSETIEASITSGQANQNIGETIKRRGRPKKVGTDDRGKLL